MRRLFGSRVQALWLAVGALAFVIAVSSCGQSPSAPGTGNLSVFMAFDNGFAAGPAGQAALQPMSDGSFGSGDRTPLADLIVSFDSITAYACADTDTVMKDEEGDASRLSPLSDDEEFDGAEEDCTAFPVLSDSTVTLSVAGLDTTLANFLGDAQLPAGDYDFLVLGMAKAMVVTQAGDSVDAVVPSGKIKVNSPFTIGDGMDTNITIVFDVNRSVVESPPGSMNFKVKPVLHAQQGWDDHEDHDGETD